MFYFSIIILAVMIILAIATQKRKLNLLCVFSLLWFSITFGAHLQLYGMQDISEHTYAIVFLGVLGFGIGYLFLGTGRRIVFSRAVRREKVNDNYINMILLKSLIVITTLFYGWVGIRAIKLMLSSMSYALIRNMYQGYYGYDSIFNSQWEFLFNQDLGHPFLYVLAAVLVLSFFENILDLKWKLISILDIGLFLLISASRFLLLYIVVELVFAVFFYQNRIKKYLERNIPKSIIGRIKRLIILLGILLFLMTFVRTHEYAKSGGYTIIQNLYAYFTIPLPLMDYWIHIVDQNEWLSYGMALIHGFVGVLSIPLKKLGFDFDWYTTVSTFVAPTEDNFIRIFPWKSYNAFVSLFYFFYLDFREIGVFIGGAIYGGICKKTDKYLNDMNSLRAKVFYLLMLQTVFSSFVRWQFFNIGVPIAFIIWFVLFIPVKIKI